MPEPDSSAPLPLSVWPTAQQPAASQRTGRYLPGSTAHPAKMLPAIARQAIGAYSQPGDLILDPMCGIGTTMHILALHAAVRQGGLVARPSFWQLTQTRKARARGEPAHLVVHEDVLIFTAPHFLGSNG